MCRRAWSLACAVVFVYGIRSVYRQGGVWLTAALRGDVLVGWVWGLLSYCWYLAGLRVEEAAVISSGLAER